MATLNPKYSPPDQSADENRWRTWYELLKEEFGEKTAKDAMARAWTYRVGSNAKTASLKSYFKGEGLDFDVGTIGNIQSNVSDFASSVGGFLKMGKTAGIVIGIVVVLLVILIVWRLARPETVGAFSAARMGGMR